MFCLIVTHLEAIGMFVPRPSSGVGVEQEPLLVFLGHVVIEVLSNGELSVQLFDGDPVILEEQEAIFADSFLDLSDQRVHDGRVVRVKSGEIDGLEFSKVMLLLGDGRWDPFRDMRLARKVSGRRVEWDGLDHCAVCRGGSWREEEVAYRYIPHLSME